MKKSQNLVLNKAVKMTALQMKHTTGGYDRGYYHCWFYNMSDGASWEWYCGRDVNTCLELMAGMDDFGGGTCL